MYYLAGAKNMLITIIFFFFPTIPLETKVPHGRVQQHFLLPLFYFKLLGWLKRRQVIQSHPLISFALFIKGGLSIHTTVEESST